MALDKIMAVKLGIAIRTSSILTDGEKTVANTIAFSLTSIVGRVYGISHQGIADICKVCSKTVENTIKALEAQGFMEPHHRQRERFSKRFKTNIYFWKKCWVKAEPSEKNSANLSSNNKKNARQPSSTLHQPLPEGLARVLERFGNAIADKYGLPLSSG